MTNSAKAKGSAFERAEADYLISRGIPCERIPAGASLDRGDLWIPIIEWPSIDTKNHRSPSLGAWCDRAEEQRDNAGRRSGFVLHKRHGVADPARQFMTTTVEMFVDLMEALR